MPLPMSKRKSPATAAAAVFLLLAFTLTEATLTHDTPTCQLRRRETAPPSFGLSLMSTGIPKPPPEPPFVANYNWVQQQFLEAHNEFRAKVGSPPLIWDSTLTRYAHDYAVKRKNDCEYRVHSGGPYGENLFWQLYKESNPKEVVKEWFGEQKFFDHNLNRCRCQPEREGCECGHYKNVVWKSTHKVGCSGFIYCNNQRGVLVVCSYHPKGNIAGENPLYS